MVDDVVVVELELVVVVVGGGGPDDTAMLTWLPGVTDAPVPGFDDTTTPAGYCADETDVTVPRLSPALPRAWPAAPWDRPISDGTMTFAGPPDTVKVTADPWLTLVPEAGFVLSTVPVSTVLVTWTMVDWRPALCRMASAFCWVVLVSPWGTVT